MAQLVGTTECSASSAVGIAKSHYRASSRYIRCILSAGHQETGVFSARQLVERWLGSAWSSGINPIDMYRPGRTTLADRGHLLGSLSSVRFRLGFVLRIRMADDFWRISAISSAHAINHQLAQRLNLESPLSSADRPTSADFD